MLGILTGDKVRRTGPSPADAVPNRGIESLIDLIKILDYPSARRDGNLDFMI
jgi:hypothetical protein